MIKPDLEEGLTFDDVLLVPARSDVLPTETDTSTTFTRGIRLRIPLCSAAMDTVTESRLAIAIAQQGGIGVIHKNFPVERQAEEVDRVKRSESGMIVDPVTIRPDRPVREALAVMEHYKISGVPVVDEGGHLVGIITNRDLRFETRFDIPVSEVMTPQPLVTVPVGTTSAGVGAVKCGIGPGRICTTRAVTGVGVPRITAIYNSVEASCGSGVPIIADGGVKFPGVVAKTIASGADVVMIGSLFAGTE